MIAVSHEIEVICNDLLELMEKHNGVINKDIVGQYEDQNKKGLKEVNIALRYLKNLDLIEYADSSEYRIMIRPKGLEAMRDGLGVYLEQQKNKKNQPTIIQTSITNYNTPEKESFWKSNSGIIILGVISSVLAYYFIEYILEKFTN